MTLMLRWLRKLPTKTLTTVLSQKSLSHRSRRRIFRNPPTSGRTIATSTRRHGDHCMKSFSQCFTLMTGTMTNGRQPHLFVSILHVKRRVTYTLQMPPNRGRAVTFIHARTNTPLICKHLLEAFSDTSREINPRSSSTSLHKLITSNFNLLTHSFTLLRSPSETLVPYPPT